MNMFIHISVILNTDHNTECCHLIWRKLRRLCFILAVPFILTVKINTQLKELPFVYSLRTFNLHQLFRVQYISFPKLKTE